MAARSTRTAQIDKSIYIGSAEKSQTKSEYKSSIRCMQDPRRSQLFQRFLHLEKGFSASENLPKTHKHTHSCVHRYSIRIPFTCQTFAICGQHILKLARTHTHTQHSCLPAPSPEFSTASPSQIFHLLLPLPLATFILSAISQRQSHVYA